MYVFHNEFIHALDLLTEKRNKYTSIPALVLVQIRPDMSTQILPPHCCMYRSHICLTLHIHFHLWDIKKLVILAEACFMFDILHEQQLVFFYTVLWQLKKRNACLYHSDILIWSTSVHFTELRDFKFNTVNIGMYIGFNFRLLASCYRGEGKKLWSAEVG